MLSLLEGLIVFRPQLALVTILLLPVAAPAQTSQKQQDKQAIASQTDRNGSMSMDHNAGVTKVDHIGFAVSSLKEAIRFWTEALGFTLERQAEMGGGFLHQVTGVDDPNVHTAILKAPDGFVVELLQYSEGHRNGQVPESAGAIGAAHLALTVQDIYEAITRVEAAGWKAKGKPLPIPGGPRKGTLTAYVSGPDHINIEFMQPARP